MANIWLALLTGLTSGGISCLAIQGGLLTSAINPAYNKKLQVASFLAAKLVAYTLLGAFLGLLGSFLTFSSTFMGWLQIAVGIYMLLTVGRLLDLHPIFRYTVIQPPSFIYKKLKVTAQGGSLFTPFLLGFSTILLPCGVTQAMMILAATSGSVFIGALIMLAFVLGTSPVFFILGLAFTEMLKKQVFSYIAALLIFILGLVAINNGQNLRGSSFTFQNLIGTTQTSDSNSANVQGGVQKVTITVTNSGYKADVDTLKVGVPVELTLVTKNVFSCSRSFLIPNYNISILLPENGSQVVKFTPTKTGRLTYTCSMGMYTGSFNVIK
jgi:sulfite exporter TauE/SafE